MSSPSISYTAGIPPLSTVKDPDTRRVLEAMVGNWRLRDGQTNPDSEQRFITKGELSGLVKGVNDAYFGSNGAGVSLIQDQVQQQLSGNAISQLVNTVQLGVLNSQLFQDLGTRIDAINLPQIFSRIGNTETVIRNEITNRQTADTNIINSVNALGVRIGNNEAGLTNETNLRVNSDNAIASAINTLWGVVGNNSALVQSGSSVTVNANAGDATNWTQVQAAVRDPVTGNILSTATVRDTATASTNAITNRLTAERTIKVDVNGYVSGFGLIANADLTSGATSSQFIVRADQFAIGSPSGPGITPRVPFVVNTTPDGNGTPPGVYIDSAFIKYAAVQTLNIGGDVVTVTRYANGNLVSPTLTSTPTTLGSVTLTVAGLPASAYASIILTGFANYSPTDATAASVYTIITDASGTSIGQLYGVTVTSGAAFSGNSTLVSLPNGVYTFYLKTYVGSPGATSKDFVGINYSFIAQAGKR